MEAARTSEAPVIDGRLDDATWARAKPSVTFTQKFPNEGAAPSERTTVRILYDDEAIYYAITVCALFNFYNRWIDASGVHALSDEAHRMGGKRSAGMGYVRK